MPTKRKITDGLGVLNPIKPVKATRTRKIVAPSRPNGVTQYELAWLAGIVDFKGNVIRKNNKKRATPQIVMYVESADLEIVDKVAELLGLTAVHRNAEERNLDGWTRRGCTEHCPEAHFHIDPRKFPVIARATVTGAALAVVLWNLLPYLMSTRIDYATLLHELLLYVPAEGQGRKAVDDAINRLESLGWTIPNYLRPKGDPRRMSFVIEEEDDELEE